MKKVALFVCAVVLAAGLISCGGTDKLTEDQAVEAVGVVSVAAQSPLATETARALGEEFPKAITMDFNLTQAGGGTAKLTYQSSAEEIEGEGLSNAQAYYSVEFSGFKVVVENEAGVETEYTLNGTMYMEVKINAEIGDGGISIGYSLLLYTRENDNLSVVGGDLDAQLELSVVNTVTMSLDETGNGSVNCTMNGTCNGQILESKVYEFNASVK